jgi:hypothetical protein
MSSIPRKSFRPLVQSREDLCACSACQESYPAFGDAKMNKAPMMGFCTSCCRLHSRKCNPLARKGSSCQRFFSECEVLQIEKKLPCLQARILPNTHASYSDSLCKEDQARGAERGDWGSNGQLLCILLNFGLHCVFCCTLAGAQKSCSGRFQKAFVLQLVPARCYIYSVIYIKKENDQVSH